MKKKLISKEDIPAVGKLLRLAHPGYAMPDFLAVEKIFGDADFLQENCELLLDEGEAIGFAMAVVRNRPSGITGYIKFIAVHPEFEGKGIGQGLLANAEEKLWNQGADTIRLFESYPNYYMPGVDVSFNRAVNFFEKAGYKKFNETANMRVQLNESDFNVETDILSLSEKQIEIRRAEKPDLQPLQEWIKENFAEWRYEINESYKNSPVSTFIALHEGKVSGFASYDTNNRGIGWFGPMGTDKRLRGLSIGRVLLKLCLNQLRDAGYTSAVIPWVGPIPFYSAAVNAVVEKTFYRYEKRRKS